MSESITKTIAYFGIFDYPLTAQELYEWQWGSNQEISYVAFLDMLDSEVLSGRIERQESFYFLPQQSSTIQNRKSMPSLLRRKMKIAKRAAKIIRFIPFVRAFFVCNQFTISTKEESDIDTFIVIKDGRMWFARFFIILLFHFFKLRITTLQSKDKICLSFYAGESHLDLSSVAIEQPDIYLTYWLEQLIPVFDPSNVSQVIKEKNAWTKKYLPNTSEAFNPLGLWKVSHNVFTNTFQRVFETLLSGSIGDSLERMLRNIQLKKLKEKNIDFDSHKTDVIVSDEMLKFHDNDRREYFKQEWMTRIGKEERKVV